MDKQRLKLTITVSFYEMHALRGACLQSLKRNARMVEKARDPGGMFARRVERLKAVIDAADLALNTIEKKEPIDG